SRCVRARKEGPGRGHSGALATAWYGLYGRATARDLANHHRSGRAGQRAELEERAGVVRLARLHQDPRQRRRGRRQQLRGARARREVQHIVSKLEGAPTRVSPPTGRPGATKIRTRGAAETQGGQRKRAEVWGETASGAPRNSRWEMHCDEGTAIGGDDTAPPP